METHSLALLRGTASLLCRSLSCLLHSTALHSHLFLLLLLLQQLVWNKYSLNEEAFGCWVVVDHAHIGPLMGRAGSGRGDQIGI